MIMIEKTIGLIAAISEETETLLRHLRTSKAENIDGFRAFRFSIYEKKALLIESGIGLARAERATRALIRAASPDAIINFGFGGAVLPGLDVGDIVVATDQFVFRRGELARTIGPSPELAEKFAEILEHATGTCLRVHRGSFISTGEITGKQAIVSVLPTAVPHPVVEMESAAVARIAHLQNIPLAAIRGISDGAGEEIDFSISDFVGHDMQVRIHKVLLTLAKKPRLLPQLIRLSSNSSKAGANLAAAILSLLEAA